MAATEPSLTHAQRGLRESALYDRATIAEIQRAAREGIYDIRGFGAKRRLPPGERRGEPGNRDAENEPRVGEERDVQRGLEHGQAGHTVEREQTGAEALERRPRTKYA